MMMYSQVSCTQQDVSHVPRAWVVYNLFLQHQSRQSRQFHGKLLQKALHYLRFINK